MSDCLFCKMIAGEIPTDCIYQDEHIFAFRDINPQAPLHVLIIPKIHIATTNDLEPEHGQLLGNMFMTAKKIAKDEGVAESGYRAVINCNAGAGQSVYHIHMHLLAGRQMNWPPG